MDKLFLADVNKIFPQLIIEIENNWHFYFPLDLAWWEVVAVGGRGKLLLIFLCLVFFTTPAYSGRGRRQEVSVAPAEREGEAELSVMILQQRK